MRKCVVGCWLLVVGCWLGTEGRAFTNNQQPRTNNPVRVVGQLINVAGRVEVRRASEPAKKGSLLFPLWKDDLLVVGEGASAEVVLFRNGARLSLSAGSTARIQPSDLKSLSGPAPRPLPTLNATFLRRMNSAPKQVNSRILGVLVRDAGDATLGPRRPTPNGAVRGTPVILRWEGPIEGEQLRLWISDGERVIQRAELPATVREFRVPAGVLRPGEYYVWSVTAFQGGDAGTKCRAIVRILLPQERQELEGIEREAAPTRTSAPEDPVPVLLLAQVYEQLGLYDDARSSYQAVLRLRPDDEGVRAAVKRLASND